eukprot:TRINITY_DN17096_c0_g2_i1.p3 TRINITY_DN17096_c0_g2~~TRINITY_DN17096_c0_g2_i1.p3  ORF type:complete len:127 (-),score=2.64 TRINITY_DN17096_c0_g2_i1:23-403(-)
MRQLVGCTNYPCIQNRQIQIVLVPRDQSVGWPTTLTRQGEGLFHPGNGSVRVGGMIIAVVVLSKSGSGFSLGICMYIYGGARQQKDNIYYWIRGRLVIPFVRLGSMVPVAAPKLYNLILKLYKIQC